jgi:hypothetical protein
VHTRPAVDGGAVANADQGNSTAGHLVAKEVPIRNPLRLTLNPPFK